MHGWVEGASESGPIRGLGRHALPARCIQLEQWLLRSIFARNGDYAVLHIEIRYFSASLSAGSQTQRLVSGLYLGPGMFDLREEDSDCPAYTRVCETVEPGWERENQGGYALVDFL